MRILERLLPVRLTDERHSVTTMELFFDLVYVFAFTQVTAWIAHEHSVLGTAQGLLILAVMWWTWVAYAWIGNVMKADQGAPLLGFIVSMIAAFVIALSIRHVWEAGPGELAPLAFVTAYLVIRVVHALVYAWGARGNAMLLRQVLISAAFWVPSAALLFVGAFAEPEARLWWWAATLALDLLGTWILAVKLGGWILPAPLHFAERFGLIVILALGESVVAVGVAAEKIELDGMLIATAILGVTAAVSFWWVYFKDVGAALEHRLLASDDAGKLDLARDAYTYLHLPLVAGIIVAAAGVEEAVFALADDEVAGVAAILIATGAAIVCFTGAALLALVRGAWQWLAVAGAFFVAGAIWMPSWNPLVALAVTTVALATVGALTPNPRGDAHE